MLKDPEGTEIARYGGFVDFSSQEGCSAIRLDPAAADGPDNWAVPDSEPCRSPGWVEGLEPYSSGFRQTR